MGVERTRPRQRGFTLLEAIAVIAITGIVAAMIASFIRAPVDSYADTVRRGQLADTADTALRRIARDVHAALPNSVRQPAGGSACFEFLPTLGGGRYRVAQPSGGSGASPLGFTAPPGTFDVLASTGTIAPGNLVAIYNLGIPGADAYAGDTTSAMAAGTSDTTIVATRASPFPRESPGRRLQVIPATSVVYLCTGSGTLVRYNQAIAAAAMAACPAAVPPGATNSALLATNVAPGACSFTYLPAATTRGGLLSMRLGLAQGGESVSLFQEVHVDNVP